MVTTVSITRKRPWWVLWQSRSKALLFAISWTVLAMLYAFLVPFTRLWLLQLAVLAIMVLNAIASWASYSFYRRHPEAQQSPESGSIR
jgi:amino acid transporter